MDRRSVPFRTGLLILLCAGASLPAQNGGERLLSLRVDAGAERPRAGQIWTVAIYADHPVPGEVEIFPPVLPASLRLERMRIVPWTGEDGAAHTKIECDILPLRPGDVTLPPFGLRAAGRQGVTLPVNVSIRGEGVLAPVPPVLVWGRPSRPPRSGEPFELRLFSESPGGEGGADRAGGTGGLSGAAADYRPVPPLNAIVEVLPPPPEEPNPASRVESGRRAILALRVIPLSGASLILEPFFLALGGFTLRSPRLELPVLPPPAPAPGAAQPSDASHPSATPFRLPAPPPDASRPPAPRPFPASPPPGADRAVFEASRAAWEAGRAAEALALLRKAERDLFRGPLLRPVRRTLEADLGRTGTADEPWRPRSLFLAGGIIGVLLTLALILLKRPGSGRDVAFARSWGYRGIVLLLTLLVLACFWGFSAPLIAGPHITGPRITGMGPAGNGSRGRYALTRAAEALRAPAPGSSVAFSFGEGERIQVRAVAGAWIYAESGGENSAPGNRGWIPLERVIFY